MIQDTRLAVKRIGERAFELTEEQWTEQAKQNQEEMSFFMHQLGDALSSMNGLDGDEAEPNEGKEARQRSRQAFRNPPSTLVHRDFVLQRRAGRCGAL